MTIGKSRETPAAYSQIAAMRVGRTICLTVELIGVANPQPYERNRRIYGSSAQSDARTD